MIEQLSMTSPGILCFKLTGKLHDSDYKTFVPILEGALTNASKLRLLVEMEDFHGWDLHAAWDDFKLGIDHYSDFERIAMVGEKDWERWMAGIAKPFTRAQIKYFDQGQREEAIDWLEQPA